MLSFPYRPQKKGNYRKTSQHAGASDKSLADCLYGDSSVEKIADYRRFSGEIETQGRI